MAEFSLQELATEVGGTLHGQVDHMVSRVATIQNATPDSITFLANRSYSKFLNNTKAAAVILQENDLDSCPVSAIVSNNPYLAYARIASKLNPPDKTTAGIHHSAVVDDSASIHESASIAACCVIGKNVAIGEDVCIGPGCVIEDNVVIKANSRLVANITICHGVSVGKNVLMHPGVVVGGDGFGIANDNGKWLKVPQLGSVRIGDEVEIGANTTIDRGALEDTTIENGVKLDNQIQVAHNVAIGEHTAIAGCTGIAGSTSIGKYCAIGGASSIVGHIDIADKVQLTVASTVTKSINEPGLYSSGTPLETNAKWHRNFIRFRSLDAMAKRIRKLEKLLENK